MPKLKIERVVDLPGFGLKFIPPFTLVWEKDEASKIIVSYPNEIKKIKPEFIDLIKLNLTAKKFVNIVKYAR